MSTQKMSSNNHQQSNGAEAHVSSQSDTIFESQSTSDLDDMQADIDTDHSNSKQNLETIIKELKLTNLAINEELKLVKEEYEQQKAMTTKCLTALADAKFSAIKTADEHTKALEHQKKQATITLILPTLDNLQSAIQFLDTCDKNNEQINAVYDCVGMSLKSIQDRLSQHNIAIIECKVGDKFDPVFHNAIASTTDTTVEKGHISSIVQSGYTMNEKVIREIMVIVSQKSQ